jgi:transposase
VSTASALDRIGVGIDTARYGHRVSFLRPDRSPAAPPLTVTEKREGYQALEERLRKLHAQHPSAHFHVRIDAAGQYAANLEQFLRGLDLPMTVSIGEPKRNKDDQKAHFPKRTTDDTESQAMARFAVVEGPAATPSPSAELALLREVCSRLQAQVKQTTREVNRLHNLLARAFPELATLTDDIAASWVLRLLEKYPTAERIAGAHLASLAKIPYLSHDQAEALHGAARGSVATLKGDVAEALVRGLVARVRNSQQAEKDLKQLLTTAFAKLPASAHQRVVTIQGIGEATAAVLVAKIVDIKRFATADHLVSYFGVFPEENSSGVDKQGHPLPAGTMHMCQKGNDLARSYLWNAARVAIRFNPAIRALYGRLKSRGKRGDVAMGHCMRKLLHLVFAVWKTDRPFDGDHYPWANPAAEEPPTPASAPAPAEEPAPPASAAAPAIASEDGGKTAVGHERDLPAGKVVTTASPTVEPESAPVKPALPPPSAERPRVDFAFLREHISMEHVLQHLGLLGRLHGRGQQRRGPCPVHGRATEEGKTFSVHLGKGVDRRFQAECGAKGNVLDLWAAIHGLPVYEAALHLAETFGLPRNREEEPVTGTRADGSGQSPSSGGQAVATHDMINR